MRLRRRVAWWCAVLAILIGAAAVPVVNAAAAAPTLNGHPIAVDGSGRIVPWTPVPGDGYGTVIDKAWGYLLDHVPTDDANGKPLYYSYSYMDPDTQQAVGWPHNPAGLYSMLTESALKYYAYSGNVAPVHLVEGLASWQLANGMTAPSDNWSSVPYSSGDAGSLTYRGAGYGDDTGSGDGTGFLQPDKVGAMGLAWAQLYRFDGRAEYLAAARAAADALVAHIRPGTATQSPWPFRVNARTGAVRLAQSTRFPQDYSANVIDPIQLFDALIALGVGDTAGYRSARLTAWTWLMKYPMTTNDWSNYFEDVADQTDNDNINQLIPMMTARYLLQHPETDPNWQAHVRALIGWVEDNFASTRNGATTIAEQNAFHFVMGSHTSRYASVNALLAAATGDTAAKSKAYYSLNWATYMARSNGVVIDGPEVNNQWFTDGYGDYIRHFLTAMQAFPEWAPGGQTHLTGSTSIVSSIAYGTGGIRYTTADSSATDVFRLASAPTAVTDGGTELAATSSLTAPGWQYNPATGVLRIRHSSSTITVAVSGGTAPPPTTTSTVTTTPTPPGSPDTRPPVISAVSLGTVNQNGASISWTTDEPADSQIEYGTGPGYGQRTSINGSLVTAHTTVVSGLDAGTTYHYRIISRDAAGNRAITGDLTFLTPGAGSAPAPVVAGAFGVVGPSRVLDTRRGVGAVAAGGSVVVGVAGVAGVPAVGVVGSVLVNVTVTEPSGAGYLAVSANGVALSGTSSVNFGRGVTVANLAVVAVGADGKIRVTNRSGGSVQVLVDVLGYYRSGAPVVAGAFGVVGPSRVLDTRRGVGAVAAGGSVVVGVAGVAGVPAVGVVGSVLVNVTVTEPSGAGYLAVSANGVALSGTSSVNFGRGVTVANLAVVAVGADGKIRVTNRSGGSVQVLVDVLGYYRSGAPVVAGAFGVVGPSRVLDTRRGVGAVAAGGSVVVGVAGVAGVPAVGVVGSVLVNVTVTEPSGAGYLAVSANGVALSGTSSVNFGRGVTVANLAVVAVGADGKIRVTNRSGGSVQVLVDLLGYTRSRN